MIQIINFGRAGNVNSVLNAFARAGAPARIVGKYRYGRGVRGVVLPGVGSFNVVPQMRKAVSDGYETLGREVPVLCICLGMQALFEGSGEASRVRGLGVISGEVRKLNAGMRLPELGWNRVRQESCDPLFAGIRNEEYFYFANSYAAFPRDRAEIIGTTEYGERFASAVRTGRWWGVQFHPERSGSAGERVIANFSRICGL